jgi:UDP-N-acetylglucosamine acyltransferase
MSARVHPTAVVAPEAVLAEDVEIGPYAVLDGAVRLGPGCVVRAHAHLCGPLTLGRGNFVGTGCVLGSEPQDLKYQGEPTGVVIGDHNVFREYVTVHRGSVGGPGQTVIGSHNLLMVNSHVGHDCVVGDRVIMANGALLGGHTVVEDRVFMSGHSATQQFSRVGKVAMVSGHTGVTKDVPPFIIVFGRNELCGVNVVGMRRAGYEAHAIDAVREAYRALFLQGMPMSAALERVERDLGSHPAVAELVAFIRRAPRGVGRDDSAARRAA